jgi:hypothetical protein
MRAHNAFRTLGLVASAIAVSAATLSVGSAAHAVEQPAAPIIQIDPATGLSDGQSVAVTGSGFTPGAMIYFGQCKSAAEVSICNAEAAGGVFADEAGNISGSLVVRTSFEGVDTGTGAPAGTVNCSGTAACVVAAGDDTQVLNQVALSFAS